MNAIKRFDRIRKEVENIRQSLIGVINQLEDFTSYEVDEVNERKSNDFESLMEDVVKAAVQLEDF